MRIDYANLARLDLNLLVAFDALIAEGHVTRAAERIGIGQSAMSHNLRRLRALFGDELLIRSGAHMLPTPRARALAQAVGNVLSELQNAVLTASVFDASRASRAFLVGISPSLEIAIMPRLLASIHADAPGVRLTVRSDSPEAMLRDVDAGILDLAVGAFAEGGGHHIRRLLCEAEGYLCLFDKRRTRLASPISMEDFVRVPHLTVLSTDQASQALDQQSRRAGGDTASDLPDAPCSGRPLRRARDRGDRHPVQAHGPHLRGDLRPHHESDPVRVAAPACGGGVAQLA